MAYASKYYDPVKAHEYYMKHRKLKGRSKRASTAGLNETGKIAAKEVKERLQAELKAELAKLPRRGATAKREALKEKYNEMYLAELDKIKADPGMAKAKKQKAAKAPKQKAAKAPKAKATTSKASTKSKTKKSTKSTSKSTAKSTTTKKTTTSTTAAGNTAEETSPSETYAEETVEALKEKLAALPEDQKELVKEELTRIIEALQKRLAEALPSKDQANASKA